MQIQTNQSQKELKNHGDYAFPLLVSYERLSSYEAGSFLWHWHPEIEITLITKGELIYHVNQLTFHLHEGEALFGNANTLHSGHMYDNKDCQYVSITFDPRLIYGFEHSMVHQKYVEPILHNLSFSALQFVPDKACGQEILQCIKTIIRLFDQKPPYWELDTISELQAFWKQMLCQQQLEPAISRQDETDCKRIREIMAYLDAHYQEKISLNDIASCIPLCTSECSRLFKRYMGVSLFTFLQEYRIEKSLPYLADLHYSITDIASLVGFSDSNYYSKVFYKTKGCSPRSYRRKLSSTGYSRQ